MSSLKVFTQFISRDSTSIDATRVISRACFELWMETEGRTKNFIHTPPERMFQRYLTGHLTATDGRKPFTPAEEEAIINVIRHKRVWPAFEGTGCMIGINGFRARGFHESSRCAPKVLETQSRSERDYVSRVPKQSNEDEAVSETAEVLDTPTTTARLLPSCILPPSSPLPDDIEWL